MHQLLTTKKADFDKAFERLLEELSGLRTGRAHPGLVENVMVPAYGSSMSLKSLATVTIPDSRTIQIEPWDQGVVKDIEKALTQAGLGSNPNVDGKIIRLVMPQMTEENRKKMVKLAGEKLEEGRVSMRQVREDIRKEVQKMEQDKSIPEDEKFKLLDELDKMTKDFVSQIDAAGKKKEEEIMTI
jgi:ribosome recycling factor